MHFYLAIMFTTIGIRRAELQEGKAQSLNPTPIRNTVGDGESRGNRCVAD